MSKEAEKRVTIVDVMRTPDRGYPMEERPAFAFRCPKEWITDLFGEFDERGFMYLDVKGEPIKIQWDEGLEVHKLRVFGISHNLATQAWYQFFFSKYGGLKVGEWRGGW